MCLLFSCSLFTHSIFKSQDLTLHWIRKYFTCLIKRRAASDILILIFNFQLSLFSFDLILYYLCNVRQGKSTLACTLGRELHTRGKLSYVLDGDNLRHGLNKDLGFKAEDRVENIRRVGMCLL